MESTTCRTSSLALGVTHEPSDHNKQISDYGFDLGGPIAAATRPGSTARIRCRTCSSCAARARWSIETKLKNPNVKLNWQATKKDMVSFLYFDGFKIKDGRSPGIAGILFDAPTATFHQDNAYTDCPLHGLWKFADDRVDRLEHVPVGEVRLLQHRLRASIRSAASTAGGPQLRHARSRSARSTRASTCGRRRSSNIDANNFLTGLGAQPRSEVRLRLPDGRRGQRHAVAGQRHPRDRAARRPICRRRCSARATAATAPTISTSTSATRSRMNRLTLDLGLRYDRQWGKALPSETAANPAFPNVVPGLTFAGYDAPFTWNNVSPRAGVTYALDEARKTVARASFSRYAGQLETGTVGVAEPELDRRLGDLSLDRSERRSLRAGERGEPEPVHHRGRRLQPGEADGGDLGRTCSIRTSRRRRPRSVVAGIDRELTAEPGRAGRTTATRRRPICSATSPAGSRRASACRWPTTRPGAGFTRTLLDGTRLQRADLHPESGHGDRRRQRVPDDEHPGLLDRLLTGSSSALVKRLSNKLDGPRRLLVQQRARALRHDRPGCTTRTATRRRR